jgi:hypothetical protein
LVLVCPLSGPQLGELTTSSLSPRAEHHRSSLSWRATAGEAKKGCYGAAKYQIEMLELEGGHLHFRKTEWISMQNMQRYSG